MLQNYWLYTLSKIYVRKVTFQTIKRHTTDYIWISSFQIPVNTNNKRITMSLKHVFVQSISSLSFLLGIFYNLIEDNKIKLKSANSPCLKKKRFFVGNHKILKINIRPNFFPINIFSKVCKTKNIIT